MDVDILSRITSAQGHYQSFNIYNFGSEVMKGRNERGKRRERRTDERLKITEIHSFLQTTRRVSMAYS
jgi:hypothetical protein